MTLGSWQFAECSFHSLLGWQAGPTHFGQKKVGLIAPEAKLKQNHTIKCVYLQSYSCHCITDRLQKYISLVSYSLDGLFFILAFIYLLFVDFFFLFCDHASYGIQLGKKKSIFSVFCNISAKYFFCPSVYVYVVLEQWEWSVTFGTSCKKVCWPQVYNFLGHSKCCIR